MIGNPGVPRIGGGGPDGARISGGNFGGGRGGRDNAGGTAIRGTGPDRQRNNAPDEVGQSPGGIANRGSANFNSGGLRNNGNNHHGNIHNGNTHNGITAERSPVTERGASTMRPGNFAGNRFPSGDIKSGFRGNLGGSERHHHANGGQDQFAGNSFHLNDRHRINLGSSSYKPSYSQHKRYHGHWSGNAGFNHGSGIRSVGYGRVSGFGPYYGIYGNGYGWGLGVGYRRVPGYVYRRYGYGYAGYYPLSWGLGGWGLGSIYYSSGYLGYSNPYYYGFSATCYDYARPIPVAYNTAVTVVETSPVTVVTGDSSLSVPSASGSAEETMDNAVALFQQGNFDAALDAIDQGIARYPTDSVLHEFRALVLFARADYQQAAATIHSVLAVGPGWDWNTLSSMYPDVAIYTAQLRALEAFTKSHPDDAASHFLLSYHYLSCGHTDAAARKLETTVNLMPNDKVAADLL
ncbi:MAG: tetratricopeptide repeat protein, partial [Planctomycetaceae bacterium]|nr:tetratricopeptide repeat protein [Planctomycetaceae bacterium]